MSKKGSKVSKKKSEQDATALEKRFMMLKCEFLQGIEIFKSFSEESIKTFLESCNEIILKDDEVLFEEGVPEKQMYIILSGDLAIYKSKKRIAVLGPGDFVGEMSLIESKERSASARAASNQVLLLEVTDGHFKKFLVSNPHALFSMMKTMSSRLRDDLLAMSRETQKINIFTHDMRNCLVPLQKAEVLLNNIMPNLKGREKGHKERKGWEEIKTTMDIVCSVTSNMVILIEQSLACALKLKSEYVKAEMEILPLIKETIDEISCHKLLRNKKIEIKVDGKIRKCLINSLDIKRVLQNLIINAGYVTGENGMIEILAKDLNDAVQVSVRDFGCGISEDVRSILLKEQVTTKPDGNGFGLISCREIIEEYHRGKINFETELNKGTTFHFTIPHPN